MNNLTYDINLRVKKVIFIKLAFGEEYDKMYPGSIYSPPSYNENFSSLEG